ncbi:MAG: cytochrome c4 precursor [Gammaproteobacteria bacterium]
MINKLSLVLLSGIVVLFSLSSMSEESVSEGEIMFEALGCSGCHGRGGLSTDERYPVLAGRDADWIVQQLEDFQLGKRVNPMMNAMAPMAEGFERVIADYLASQEPPDGSCHNPEINTCQ